ncbi:hypothetical protein DXG03_002370 [Asterophora parasitica]|uniref:Meiotically up-regulated protein Msb1/Mug8 domain-containing protein n=1 Tax=Asterophora parasitica TaxID=117018 RepID=A0A9P7K9V1_9AGAR|nr:hypothetical protein DXG03_002370 [Asterophora parasitica]
MPSFLSKVFGRKKDDKESPRSPGRVSDPELLDGKFESVSPSATKFPEVANGKGEGKDKEKDASFTLFRAKYPTASPDTNEKHAALPLLSLNLPGPKDNSAARALGAVFEADPDATILLSDAVIGSRRLSPLETLILVKACSQAITARGLETLGIMHPHWYSASPEIQRRLISLFIHSLATKSPITTLSPTSSTFITAFESEISSTRSPHDVAAVLRWGLRHLELEGNSFGKDDSWYKTFFDAERSSEYPPNGFSTTLGPTLPASHLELLKATLEVLSSLAAHAEANGISGSKLSKFFGLWLLTIQRAHANDDWATFYARWERTGRILEHIFLSRIRDEAVGSRLPTRLLELVKQYPYDKAPSSETDLLPRPRFSTRRYDALFVRIETELSATADQPAHHPLRLISDAFKAEAVADAGEYVTIWESIRKAGLDETTSSPGSYPGLSRIFADETLRFFSLIPIENGVKEPTSPTFNLFIGPSRRRSFSLNNTDDSKTASAATAAAAGNDVSLQSKLAVGTSSSPVIGTDWTTFSTSGFFEEKSDSAPLAATLMEKDKDLEVTRPKTSSTRPKPIPSALSSDSKSLDAPWAVKVEQPKSASAESVTIVSKSTQVSLTQLDEAFIDFWSDALLDPISSTWPAFIICKLKSTPIAEIGGKRLEWLVIEQTYKRPAPPTPVTPETATTTTESHRRPRPSSPKSFKSDTTFSSTRKRFSFWASGRTSTSSEKGTKSKKKGAQGSRVGEMGEILAEEDEIKEKEKEQQAKKEKRVDTETVRVRVPSPKPKKSTDVPRKSVDVGKKSVDGAAAAALLARATAVVAGTTAVVTGTAVVATLVSTEAVKGEEVATPPAVPEVPATVTNAPEAVVEDVTPATKAKEVEIEASAAPASDAPTVESAVADEPVAVESTHAAAEEPTPQATTDEPQVEEPAVQPAPAVLAAKDPAVSETVSHPVDLAEPLSAPEPVPEVASAAPVVLVATLTEVPAGEEEAVAAVVEPIVAKEAVAPEVAAEEAVPPAPAAEAEPEAKAVVVEPVEPTAVEPEVAEPAVKDPTPVEALVTEPEVAPTPDVEHTPVSEPQAQQTGVEVVEPATATEEAAVSTPLVEAAVPVEETTPAEPEAAPAVEAAPAASVTPEINAVAAEETISAELNATPAAPEASAALEVKTIAAEAAPVLVVDTSEAPAAAVEVPVPEVMPAAAQPESVFEEPVVVEEPSVIEAAVVEEPITVEAAVEEPAAPAIEESIIEEPAAVETPTVEAPVAVDVPAAVQVPAAAEEAPAVEETTNEEPAAVEVPVGVEVPDVVRKAVVEEPTTIVEPPIVEEPATATEEPVAVEEPAVEEPAVEEPAAVEEFTTEEPVAVEVPAAVEEPAAAEEPVAVEEPAAVEAPEVPSPHVEPPHVPEEGVTLPTVPIVEAESTAPVVEDTPIVGKEVAAPALVEEKSVKPDEEPTPAEAPQVVLDTVVEPSEEAAPKQVESVLVGEAAAEVTAQVAPLVDVVTATEAPVEAEISPQRASGDVPALVADAAAPFETTEEPKEEKTIPQQDSSTADITSSTPAAAPQD